MKLINNDPNFETKSENPIFCYVHKILYMIPREKFEPEPGFEPQTSRSLARRSTT